MSLSDLFNISQTVRRDKAHAQDLLPTPSSSTPARLCNICYANPAAYNCPRCNIPFCSLVCFRRKEHQECSTAFSSSAISVASGTNNLLAEERDRSKVVEILARLERNEKQARQAQEDAYEDDDSNISGSDGEDGANATSLRAELTAEQIEAASTERLLAMLTPKERQRFLEAVKDPHSAASLMERLDRKAERRARTGMARSTPQGALVVSQSSENGFGKPDARREWQSEPWFNKPEASPDFSSRPPEHVTSFLALIEQLLSTERASTTPKDLSAPVDLMYNLCAVLMAYAYILRHLDITSLSNVVRKGTALKRHSVAAPNQASFSVPQPLLGHGEDDEEPPPLEPDTPIDYTTDPTQPQAAPQTAFTSTANGSQDTDNVAMAEQAFVKLHHLVPFLFQQPPPTSTNATATSHSDHSKVLLSSLDDAFMWLLSRLSLETEVGHGGADAINLQLLQDLARLTASEQLVPTFAQDQEVELRHQLTSRLASLLPQQAFASARMPLLLNAVADIYFLLEDLPPSISTTLAMKPKYVKLTQRKLCFYLCSAIDDSRVSTQRASLTLSDELQDSIQHLRQRIEAAEQADKIAAAVHLLDKDAASAPIDETVDAAP